MTRGSFAWITPAVVAAAGIVGLACSSSSTGPKLTPQALVGAYTLDTLSVGGMSASPPAVAGTLQLTDSTYKVNVTEGPAQLVKDSGTYTVSGSTFTETSLTGLPAVTATASLRGNNDTLDVNVTSPAQAAGTFVWVRVP